MATTVLAQRIAALRRFNRFYTQKIGILRRGVYGTAFSLTEARVLYELAHRRAPTAAEIARDLDIDAGYLSRILRAFVRRGLVTRARSAADRRHHHLVLSRQGRRAFAPLNRRSEREIAALLAPLSAGEQHCLIAAAQTIESVLSPPKARRNRVILRAHRPGDLGWIVHRHDALYAREYGWSQEFEAVVAEIAATFIRRYDARREHCWIAERDGAIIGSVALVSQSKTVAKVRLLLVEPEARGMGIGERLVGECMRFARAAGYRKITLWTNSILDSARRIYLRANFRLVASERHRSFGHRLVGETWELDLTEANS